MSLSFQNSEHVKQAILEELHNLLSADRNVSRAAEERMSQLQFTEGYGVHLAEVALNQSCELPLRQLACIMLTRYVEQNWNDFDENGKKGEDCFVATDHAKRMIRNVLPNGLYDPNSKIRLSVAHTIQTIASTDWPTVWPDLFDIIIKCLSGNEDSMHGAMEILKDFNYDEKQLHELGPVIISEVCRIFESEQSYNFKTRISALRTLKPLFLSITVSVNNRNEQMRMMDTILINFMPKMLHYLSTDSGTASNFLFRTEIVKMLTYLTSDMPKYLYKHINSILPVVWQLLTQVAGTYVNMVVNRTEDCPPSNAANADDDDDEAANFCSMIVQIFEFVQCIIDVPKFRPTINSVLDDLIYIVIVYAQATQDLIEEWNEEPDRFVNVDDENAAELTIRVAGQDVLRCIATEAWDKVLPALQEAVRRHINVAEAEKAAGGPHWWKINESCMVAVNIYRDLILENEHIFDLKSYLTLVRSLLNFNEYPQLVARALCILSGFSTSDLYNAQMLEEILNVAIESLSRDKEIVLRISAIRAISDFLDTHEKANDEIRAIIKPKLDVYVAGIMDVVPGCTSNVLSLLLESLTSVIKFDGTFAATAQNKIIPLTLAVFLKYPEDPYILEIVQDMIKALSQNPMCQQPLQEKFIPTIVSILSLQSKQAKAVEQDIAMDVLTNIVRYSQPPLSAALLENAFPAMIHCVLRTEDHAVMVSGGECLRAYIHVSPEQVCGYNNGEGLQYTIQLTTMLLNPMISEMTAGQIGRLVVTIITKMGTMLGENVDLLLKAVISKMQLVECLRVVMSLVVIFAHLFLTQMEPVLNFLSTVPGPTGEPAIQFVFNHWLSKQPLFFGAYERKVTTMALCKLFEYGLTTQDPRITSITIKEPVQVDEDDGSTRKTRSQTSSAPNWVSIPVLVKILKLLIYEVSDRGEFEVNDYDTDTEDDGDTSTDVKKVCGSSPPKVPRNVSDLYFNGDDDNDDSTDDDHMLKELAQNPFFQAANIEENLVKFLQNFASSEHFPSFVEHLTVDEKNVLKSVHAKGH